MRVTVHPDGSGTSIEIDESDRELSHDQFMATLDCLTRVKKINYDSDHLWDPRTLTCMSCGITKLDYHSVPYGVGLACLDNRS